jgi:hypothetical protein
VRVAADGKKKISILTTEPAGPIPTTTELNGGIDASPQILDSDIAWTNTASDTFNEKSAAQKGNALALGASNYDLGLTFLREYAAVGGAEDPQADAGYQAVKVKGTTVWIYVRENAKDSGEPWADTDVIDLGGEVQSDAPSRVDNTGNIKRRVVFVAQTMIEGETVAAGTI